MNPLAKNSKRPSIPLCLLALGTAALIPLLYASMAPIGQVEPSSLAFFPCLFGAILLPILIWLPTRFHFGYTVALLVAAIGIIVVFWGLGAAAFRPHEYNAHVHMDQELGDALFQHILFNFFGIYLVITTIILSLCRLLLGGVQRWGRRISAS